MSTEKMRKLMMLAESLDEDDRQDAMDRFPDDYAGDMEDLATTSSGDEYCPTCDGWGEYMPKGSSMGIDFDDIVPCPDCGPESGYKPRLKSQVIKDLAHEIDADWVDYDLVDVDPADLKGFPKVDEGIKSWFSGRKSKKIAEILQQAIKGFGSAASAASHIKQNYDREVPMVLDLLKKYVGGNAKYQLADDSDYARAEMLYDMLGGSWEDVSHEKTVAGLEEQDDPDDLEWEAEWARQDGDDELANDLEWEAMWARQDAEDEEYAGDPDEEEVFEVQTLPREIKDRKPIKPDWSDVEYETCADCGVEGGHENDCPTLAALYNEDLNEEQSEFLLKDIVGADNFAELVSDMNTGGIDYSAAYFTPLYWHFLDEYPDEIPVGSRTGRPEDPEQYVLDNLERYHSEEIKSYMNTPDMDESNCGVCGETFKWEGSPDEEMCPRCTQEYLGEAKCEKCGREGCECGDDCDCEPVEEKKKGKEVKGANDKYDDELKCMYCGDYYCTSKFGGECPAIQRDLFDEVSLESIAESLLDERSQPKDYEMSDEELAAEIEDETSEFERDHIDKEIEDEELGLRFD